MTNEPIIPRLYSTQEFADMFGWKLKTVYRLIKKKSIDVIVLGGEYKFTKEAIDKFLKSRTVLAKE